MKPTIDVLKPMFKGRPAAVLGAGPQLPDDIKRLPDNCTMFAVNGHAQRIVDCDAFVFMDAPTKIQTRNKPLYNAWMDWDGIIITQFNQYATHTLDGVDYWDGGFSGSLATWAACYLEADPVILCGMDCYRSKRAYFHKYEENKAVKTQRNYPLENHLNAWRPALSQIKNVHVVRVMSGPLVEIFPPYDLDPVNVYVHDVTVGTKGGRDNGGL